MHAAVVVVVVVVVQTEEFKCLWDELACVLDAGTITGTAQQRKGSTVVDLSVAGHFRIIREGVRFEDTLATLEKHSLSRLPETVAAVKNEERKHDEKTKANLPQLSGGFSWRVVQFALFCQGRPKTGAKTVAR